MGRVGSEELIPVLLPMIGHRAHAAAAREGLVGIGAPALARLAAALDEPELPSDVRWNLPRAIGMFEPASAAPVLVGHLAKTTDGMMRFRILRVLSMMRSEDPTLPLDPEILARVTEDTVRDAFRCLDWRVSLVGGSGEATDRDTSARELLVTLLRDKETHAVARLCRVLGLVHPGENFERIYRGLLTRNPKTRASSLELIENLVALPLRTAIIALVEDLPDRERLERAEAWFRPERLGYDDVLHLMIERGGEAGSLARYHAKEIGLITSPGRSRRPGRTETALGEALAAREVSIGVADGR
jgi:hypothetical protein